MLPRSLPLCALVLLGCTNGNEDLAAIRYVVLQKLDHSVAFYSAEGQLLETVPVGQYPHEMILSPDGQLAYVTDYGALGAEYEGEGGTTVSIIDVAEQKKSGTIDLANARRPHGLDIDESSGNILVTTENPDRLLIVDPVQKKVLNTFSTNGRSSHMVTLSPDGTRAYVSNIATQNVSIIDLATGTATLIPVGERPEGSDVTADGKTLFVACRESDVVSVIDTDGNTVIGEVATGSGPNRVKLTPDERHLVYTLVHDNQIGFADVATLSQVATITLDGSPVSLQLSSDGARVLTASQDTDEVYVISVADRRVITRFKTEAGAGPDPVLEIEKTATTER
jgi:YVTN family beta-propeller protein